jgi:site-specific recombinase XerD
VCRQTKISVDILSSYLRRSKDSPKRYLLEREQTAGAFPTRTIQRIFQLAKKARYFTKDVGTHVLRHRFTAHLFEKGTDTRYIKELLRQFNIKTTERYVHVSRKSLVDVIRRLDDLWRKGKGAW